MLRVGTTNAKFFLDLLVPITHPSQVPSHLGVSKAFTSKTLRVLSRSAMDVINEEHKHAVQFARLMSMLLGDGSDDYRQNTQSLPIYDHLDGLADPSSHSKEEANGNTKLPVKSELTNSNYDGRDAFFAAPMKIIDRNIGVRQEDIEDTTQLTQIAQQRSEEFIRCMNKVRHGLLKAERYQGTVFKWCQEMAGIEDDSDGMDQPNGPSPESSRDSSSRNSIEASSKK